MANNPLNNLSQFTGTERWYRHSLFRQFTYTDGVRYVAQTADAYWLLDRLFSLQYYCPVRSHPFQVWRLVMADDGSATLLGEDGNDNQFHHETLRLTDFPVPGITLWFTDKVLLLPSEY